LFSLINTMTLQCTGIMVGHVSPEAYCGGNLAFIQNGDIVTIDPVSKTLDMVCLSLVITMCMRAQVCMSACVYTCASTVYACVSVCYAYTILSLLCIPNCK